MGDLLIAVIVLAVLAAAVVALVRARRGRQRLTAPPTATSASPEVAEPVGPPLRTAQPPDERLSPEVHRPGTAPASTLPELLVGVTLPCGLAPTVGADQPGPERYLALVTGDAPPDEVGPALADELERLGYELHSLTEDEAVARRGDDLLSMKLHPRADLANLGGIRLFPTAGEGTVAVELWAGAGPNPRVG